MVSFAYQITVSVTLVFLIILFILLFKKNKQIKKYQKKEANLNSELNTSRRLLDIYLSSFAHYPDIVYICELILDTTLKVKFQNENGALFSEELLKISASKTLSFSEKIDRLFKLNKKNTIFSLIPEKSYYETELKFSHKIYRFKLIKVFKNIFMLILTDITSPQNAITNLHQSQMKYKNALWSLGESILLIQSDKVIEMNEKAQQLFQKGNEALIGNSVGQIIGHAGWKKIKSQLEKEKVFKQNIVLNLDEEKYFEVTVTSIEDTSGIFLMFLKNLTKEKEQLDLINKLNIFKEKILGAIPSTIIVINRQYDLIEINHNNIFDINYFHKEEMLNKNIFSIFPNLSTIKEFVDKVDIKNNEILNTTINLPEKLDNKILNIAFYPIQYHSSELILIRIDDVTQQKHLEDNLLQTQKMEMIGQLAGGLVHDFNNILASISGVSSLMDFELKENKLTHESIQKKINVINVALPRAGELISRLLVLGRKITVQKKLVDIKELIKESIEIVEPTIPDKIKLNFSFPPFPIYVYADYTHIQQVIINLIQNAKDAMLTKGDNILISVFNDSNGKYIKNHLNRKKWIRISVKDNGPGIPLVIRNKIFTPFFTTKSSDMGTGLGLAMVYSLIKEQGGEIELISEEGKGADFQIYLPKIIDKHLMEVLPEEETIYPGKGNILIVDDDEVIRLVAANMLTRCGYEITMANNGQMAIEFMENAKKQYDLVILDLIMPKKNGYETYIEMLEKGFNIPVIVATGFKDDILAQDIGRKGAKIIMQKPFTIGQLSKAIYQILSK